MQNSIETEYHLSHILVKPRLENLSNYMKLPIIQKWVRIFFICIIMLSSSASSFSQEAHAARSPWTQSGRSRGSGQTFWSNAYQFSSSSGVTASSFSPGTPMSTGFVQRVGSNLYLNGKTFRFAGSNIYWLGLTDHPTTTSYIIVPSGGTISDQTGTAADYPSLFQIDDALQTAQEMGATVVRSFALATVGCSLCIEPSLGSFNNNAFNTVDYAIQQAKAYGIKLMFPLVDNYYYYSGGRHTFTDWEKDNNENDFYKNSAVINDYENYINHVLNHVNTYSGIAYKDDPTILAWETGNELTTAPANWTQKIASYIKSIDSHHLVADGSEAISSSFLKNDSVDLYTDHFYPPNNSKLISDATTVTQYKKVYFVGEYDWVGANGGDSLTSFLSTIESSAISGDLFWGVFPHNETYGYVSGDQYTLHYTGDTSDYQTRALQLRRHAYTMRGLPTPVSRGIAGPYLHSPTANENGVSILWRGAIAAATYNVQRSTGNNDWTTIATGVTDNNTPYVDATAVSGHNYCYRVQGVNLDGRAGAYSNVQTIVGNQIQNGSFEYPSFDNALSFWRINNHSPASLSAVLDSTTSTEANVSVKVTITQSDGIDWHAQFLQQNIYLNASHTYKISFSAKADAAKTMKFSFRKNISPYTTYYLNSVNLTTSWQNFNFSFTPSATDSAADLFFDLGATTGNVWIDNVVLSDSSVSRPTISCEASVSHTFSSPATLTWVVTLIFSLLVAILVFMLLRRRRRQYGKKGSMSRGV